MRSLFPTPSAQLILRTAQPRSFWYWLIVFPIKWCLILVTGLVCFMLVVSLAFIAFVPWVILRATQHKSLIPDFLSSRSKTKEWAQIQNNDDTI